MSTRSLLACLILLPLTGCAATSNPDGDDDDDGPASIDASTPFQGSDGGGPDPEFQTDAGPNDPDAGAGPLTIPEYFHDAAHDYCVKFFACCTTAEAAVVFASASPPVTDVASCEMLVGALNGFRAAEAEAAVAGGKMTWDPAVAADCLATITSASCTAFAEVAGPYEIFEMHLCAAQQPLAGTIPDGMPCTDYLSGGQSCASGYCEQTMVGGQDVYTCRPLPTVGQPCPEYRCATGAFCDAGTCKAPRPDGQPCEDAIQCASHGCQGADFMGAVGVCGAPNTCDGP